MIKERSISGLPDYLTLKFTSVKIVLVIAVMGG
jgi:hypothetical protein